MEDIGRHVELFAQTMPNKLPNNREAGFLPMLLDRSTNITQRRTRLYDVDSLPKTLIGHADQLLSRRVA